MLLIIVLTVLGGQQHGTAMCSPVASSPDLTCMDKPAVHGFRSYGSSGTSCGGLPVLSSGIFGTVSVCLAC